MKKEIKFNLSKKKIVILSVLIAVIMLATTIGILIFNKSKLNSVYSGELARSMQYTQVEDGDENIYDEDGNIVTEFVKFDAFFLRDITGDGYAEKLRGSARKIGESDTLYMELNVLTNGYLKEGATITINNDNFYFQSAIPKDNEVKENAIGNNIKEIKLNQINNGTQKLLTGITCSGDYNYTSSKASAIGSDVSKYSRVNTITLRGTHVAEDGTETPFEKTVWFEVDWHGTTKTEIPYYLAGSRNLNREQNIANAIDEEKQTFTVEHNLGIQEIDYKLNLKTAHIETEIPQLNGRDPISVEVIGNNTTYEYDETTRKLTAQKDAVVDENGILTSQAYDGIYYNNRYNRFKVKITYPLEAYQTLGQNTVESNLIVKAYYEGYNNWNSEFTNPYRSNAATQKFTLTIKNPDGTVADFDVTVGKYVYNPTSRYIVSKENPLRIYNGISDKEENDTYEVRWYAYTGTDGESTGIVMKEGKNGNEQISDLFVKNDGSTINLDEISTNVGIYFSNPENMLGTDGEIKVVDDETDELIVTFTSKEWSKYNSSNPYRYEKGIKHIRIETSKTNKESYLYVYNIKNLDDEKIAGPDRISKDDFDKITHIKSTVNGYLGGQHVTTDYHSANYEAPYARAELSLSKSAISTQETEKNMVITIKAQGDENINKIQWVNGAFLLKMPKDILDLEINNVTSSNPSVIVESYGSQVEEDGITYIKIITKNKYETSFNLNINCNITPDPRIATQNEKIELYAYNEKAVAYWRSSQDIYDVNNNLNYEEMIGKEEIGLNLVSPDSLLTSEIVTNYDDAGSITVAPQVAILSKEQRTADITIDIKNNYSNTISDVSILGRIPYEDNKYTINGNEMGSNFSATMHREIRIPEELQGKVKVYYNTNGEAGIPEKKDTDEATQEEYAKNGWIETPEDLSQIKSYLIEFIDYTLQRSEQKQFSYTISLPENLNYNQTVYSHHAIYFTLDTPEGKYRTQTEPNKVGLTIAKRYNLELTKYQTGKNKVVSGATYSISEEKQDIVEGLPALGTEETEAKIRTTGIDGKLELKNLLVDKTYVVKEVNSPSEYEINYTEIKFRTYEENGQLHVEVISETLNGLETSGTLKSINAVQADSENGYRVQLEVQDEVKPGLKVVKVQRGTDTKIQSVKFKLTDGESAKTLWTNSAGELQFKGLKVGVEYTLEEVEAKGYYLENPVKFTIENNEGSYIINIAEGNAIVLVTEETDSIPTVGLKLENDKIPTYNLQINKVAKGTTMPLAGAKFRLFKGTEKIGDYTTNENGNFVDASGNVGISNLYQYEADRNIDQTYTLKEILAPDGYSVVKDITFKVENKAGTLELVEELQDGQTAKEYTVEGNTVTITVEDTPSFKLIKKDGETGEILPGTKFAIYNVDDGTEQLALDSKFNILGTKEIINGKEYYTLTTNEKGEITADLREGLYKAVEIQANHEKYDITDNVYYFGIGASREGKTTMVPTWATAVGGSGYDKINSVVATKDGGYVVGGYFRETMQVGDYTLTSKGEKDGFIIKYKRNEEVEWATTVGGNEDDQVNSLTVTKDGGIVAGGLFHGTIQLVNGTLIANRLEEGFIIKYKENGEIEWTIATEGINDDRITSIMSTEDGGIIVGGEFDGKTKIGDYVFTCSWKGGFIVKCKENGEIQWGKTIDYNSNYHITSVAEINGVGYVVGGYFSGTMNLGNITLTHNNGDYNAFIIKYNNIGEVIWATSFGESAKGKVNSIVETQDGGYIAGGNFSGTMQVGEYQLTSNGGLDGVIIKYSKTGEVDWATSFGGSGSDYINSVVETQDGSIVVVGCSYSYMMVGTYSLSSNTTPYGFIIKYNQSFKEKSEDYEVKYATTIGGSNSAEINSVIQIEDEGIVVGGSFYHGTIQIGDYALTNKGYDDGLIIKYSEKELANPETIDAVSIGGSDEDGITCITVTSDGGYVVGGFFSGTMQVGDYTLTSNGYHDGFIIKYEESGKIEWCKKYDYKEVFSIISVEEYIIVGIYSNTIIKYSREGEELWRISYGGNLASLASTNDRGIVSVGKFYGTMQVGDYTLTNKGDSDGFIIKYTEDGEVEWATSVGGNDDDLINSVVTTSDRGMVVAGDSNSSAMQVETYTLTNKGGSNGFIIKYTEHGEVEWATSVGGSGWNSIESVVETTDKGIVVAGDFNGTIQLEGHNLMSKGDTDGLLIKYSSNGKVEWITSYGDKYQDHIKSIVATKDGGIVVGGRFDIETKVEDYIISRNDRWLDGIIIKYNSSGKVEWIKLVEGRNGDEYIDSVVENSNGAIIAGGYFTSSTIETDGKVLTNKGSKNGMLLKIVNFTGVPEVQELTVENKRKEFKITTDVQEIDGVKGGNISGEDLKPYETVKYGDNSTKEIKMLPNDDYEIIGITVNGAEHPFTANEDGTYTMPIFDNMTEDKHVVVTYSLKDNKITINKVDSFTKESLTGAKFRLDQIEERAKPQNVVGNLTDNSNVFTESKLLDEVTGVLGELINNADNESDSDADADADADADTDADTDVNTYTYSTTSGRYYFVKNADGTLTPTNSKTYQIANGGNDGIHGVTANSYIPIDLTGKTGIYVVKVNAKISSEQNYDFGYATVTENTTAPTYDNETGRFIYKSGTESAKDYFSGKLEGGKTYYLHLGYRKDGSASSGEDQITINNINVYKAEYVESRYNFKEENGEYKSTNQGKANTTSNSYIPIDLSSYTGKYNLSLKAKVSSDWNDYGYITINQSTTAPAYNNSTGRFVYISGTTNETEYSTVLQGGNKYYLHLGYYKNASTDSGDDTFTVSDIKVTLNDSELYHVDIETNSDGQAITQIPFGKYSLTEIVTPEGYEVQRGPVEIEFRSDGTRRVLKCAEEIEDENGNIIKSPKVTVNENGEFVVENISTAKVIVEHYIKGTEIKLADDVILEGKQGEDYTTSPLLNLQKYELEKDESGEYVIPENAFGKYTQETIIVKYYYVEKEIPLTVHHYIEGTENKVPLKDGNLAEDVNDFGTENAPYTTEPIADDILSPEYELVEVPTNKDGVYSGEEVIVIYYYKKIERNIIIQKYQEVKEINKETGEEIVKEVPLEGAKFQITEANPKIKYIKTEPIQNNAEYYFSRQENGSYASNNKNIQESISNSYIKIDATEITGYIEISVNAEISSEQNYDWGYAIITESAENPFISIRRSLEQSSEIDINIEEDIETYAIINRPRPLVSITGMIEAQDYSSIIEGGKVYYLHLGYRKDNVDLDPVGDDTFTINAVSINGKNIVLDENNDVEYVTGFSENCTTEADGKITIKLESGKYNITEIEAPEGFELPENPTTEIEITKDTEDGKIIKIVNDKKKGKVVVHHYVMEYDGTLTTTPVPLLDGTDAQDETKEGYIGDMYATRERTDLAPNWKFIEAIGNTSGEYIDGIIEVNYYYQEQINIEDTISILVTKKWVDNDIQALRRPNTIKFRVKPYEDMAGEMLLSETMVANLGEVSNNLDENADLELPEDSSVETTTPNGTVDTNKENPETQVNGEETDKPEVEDTSNNTENIPNVTEEKTQENKDETSSSADKVTDEVLENNTEIEDEEKQKEDSEAQKTEESINSAELDASEKEDLVENTEIDKLEEEEKSEISLNKLIQAGDIEEYIIEFPNRAVDKTTDIQEYELSGLPKYNKITGKKIKYIVEEVEENEGDLKFYEPTGGIVTEEVDEAGNIKYTAEIVNTFKPLDERKDITVTKAWKDKNSASRPQSIILDLIGTIEITLQSESVEGENADGDNTEGDNIAFKEGQEVSEETNWKHTFTNVPVYDENGQEIMYSADEEAPENNQTALDKYIAEISPINEENEIIITNSLIVQDSKITKMGPEEIRAVDSKIPYVIDYTVELDEKYEDNANIEIVDTLEYELVAEKSELAGGIVGENNKTITWIGTYNSAENKVAWDNDTQDKIQVEIAEDTEKQVKIITIHMEINVVYKSIPLECDKVINKITGTITLTNNVEDKKEATCETPTRWVKDVIVNKLWNGDTESTRPDSIEIELKLISEDENGNQALEGVKGFNTTITPITTAEGKVEWTYTYKDLPRYDADGNEFKYTVDETEVNYTKGEQTVENKYYCEKSEEVIDSNTVITLTNNVYGSIIVTKVDSRKEDVKLQGAEFKLERVIQDESGNWIVPDENSEEYSYAIGITTEDGTYIFENLKYGFYKLTEIKAPEDYRISKEELELIEVSSSNIEVQITVRNDKKYSLPTTGGLGIDIIRNAGILVVSIFAIILTNRKKIVPVKRSKIIEKPARRKK